MGTLLWCFLLWLLLLGVKGAKNDTFYYVAGIGPLSPPYNDFLTFAKFAAFLVNNNDKPEYANIFPGFGDVLPNATLIVDTYDVGTNEGLASLLAVEAYQKNTLGPLAAYLGGVRTAQQTQVVYVADYLNITYVGGVVSGATFSDKSEWPMFSRTSLTDQFMSEVMVKFLHELGIQEVALVYQDDDFGTGNYAAFSGFAQQFNISIAPFEIKSLSMDFSADAQAVKDTKYRIIVLITEYAEGQTFLTNACEIGMVGDEYLWLFGQVFSQAFSRQAQTAQYLNWTKGSILFKPYADRTNASIAMEALWNQSDPVEFPYKSGGAARTPDTVAWYMADALYTIAFALDRYLKAGGNTTKIDGNIVHHIICDDPSFTFTGVSGIVEFDSNCDRKGIYNVLNYAAAGVLNNIQTYDPLLNNGAGGFSALQHNLTYYDGSQNRPRDTPCECVHGHCDGYTQNCICDAGWVDDKCQNKDPFRKHSVALSAALGAIVGISIIISIFALVVLAFRKSDFAEKSPLFCNIIICGTIITYIGALCLLPEPTDSLCMTFPWLIGIGFTFVFGCLFLKTWRVYHIIDGSMKMERVKITNFYIIRLVAGALLIEVIFLIVWTATYPLKARIEDFNDGTKRMQCSADHQEVFWGVFAGYKLIWLVFGAVMAVKTRFYYDEYNDSRAIALSIYNSIVTLAIGIPIAVVLRNFAYVVVVIEVAIVLVMFNFTLIAIFFNTWMLIFFGPVMELPDLKPQQSQQSKSGSNSSGSNNKSSASHSGTESKKGTTMEVYVA